jgi:chromosome partitioning protein
MITLIASQKGGTGKSTIAASISAELARQGKDVMLVDADKQLTAIEWWTNRRGLDNAPKLACVQSFGYLDETLLDLDKRYEHVIVDCGGVISPEMMSALTVCHTFLSPIETSQIALNTMDAVNVALKQALRVNPTMRPFVVLSKADANPAVTRIADSRAFLQDYPLLKQVEQVIYHRLAYQDCTGAGYGATEFTNPKAAEEITNLMREIYGEN